jgi:probable rRNA maturation factor
MPVAIICRSASARRYERRLRADGVALLRILGLEHCELSLVMVGDRAIRRLNRDFRAKDQATDVLSFPQFEGKAELKALARGGAKNAPPIPIGDIVISIETASRQARELEQSAAARLRTLLIHGLLHLTGYDHERSAAETRRMFKREHELAELMDIARPQAKKVGAKGEASVEGSSGMGKAGSLLWSPAAMPERGAKAMESVGGRRSKLNNR